MFVLFIQVKAPFLASCVVYRADVFVGIIFNRVGGADTTINTTMAYSLGFGTGPLSLLQN